MQIINAASVVFAKGGFATSRISDVAEEAGIAQGTIYRFFESKEDLAMALFDVGQEACRAELARLIDEIPPEEPLRVVREYVHWYATYLVRRRGIVVALFSWELDPAGRHGADIGERPWIADRLSELLEAAGVGNPTPGADLGRLIPMVLYGLTAFADLYRSSTAQTDETLAETVTDITLRLIGIEVDT